VAELNNRFANRDHRRVYFLVTRW